MNNAEAMPPAQAWGGTSTVQPFDAPEDDPGAVQRILDHLRSDDMLLWASDWPHWQFDGDAAVPPGFPESLLPKLLRGNALETYDRIREGVPA